MSMTERTALSSTNSVFVPRYLVHNPKNSLIAGSLFICSTQAECLECQGFLRGIFCGYHSLVFLASRVPGCHCATRTMASTEHIILRHDLLLIREELPIPLEDSKLSWLWVSGGIARISEPGWQTVAAVLFDHKLNAVVIHFTGENSSREQQIPAQILRSDPRRQEHPNSGYLSSHAALFHCLACKPRQRLRKHTGSVVLKLLTASELSVCLAA